MIDKVEVEDTKATIRAMVAGAQHRHAKRSKKVFFIGDWHLYFGIVLWACLKVQRVVKSSHFLLTHYTSLCSSTL